MRDSFADCHPFVNFIYFAAVIGFSLVLTHPLAQVTALVCAFIYAVTVSGRKMIGFLVKFCLPTVLLTMLINPLFNHRGETALLYFSNGNPLTLESIVYGVSAGAMLVSVLMWFSSFNRVMTSDKFIYLFGKVIPALSLVLSMTLRFVPKFRSQMETVSEAQKSIGRDVTKGNLLSRTKTAINIFSIMITWSLENAIETADSMKSRGYGLRGRTTFSLYRLDSRDKTLLIWLFFCISVLIAGAVMKAFSFSCFPEISFAEISIKSLPFYVVYAMLCMTPVILDLKEEIKWKISASEM